MNYDEKLEDLLINDPYRCLEACNNMLNNEESSKDQPMIRFYTGVSYMNIALKELPTDPDEIPSEIVLKACQGALVHLNAAFGLSKDKELRESFQGDKDNQKAIDRICATLEKNYPGCISKHKLWDVLKLKYLGERIWYHPLKEKEAIEIIDIPFPPPGIVRSVFVAAGGTTEDKQEMLYVYLFEYENPWDESTNKLKEWIKEIHFVKDKSGKWSYGNLIKANPTNADSGEKPAAHVPAETNNTDKRTSPSSLADILEKAEQGDANAQYNLGVMYFDGEGVPQDDNEAVKWYRKAAEQGFSSAQNKLGYCYLMGKGVPENERHAAQWYCKAAEQGHSDAQYILGVMYKNGEGVPQDNAEAIKWFRKAAAQGDMDAQERILEITSDLNGKADYTAIDKTNNNENNMNTKRVNITNETNTINSSSAEKTSGVYADLHTKPKVLIEAIKSGKMRDIIDNEFMLDKLSWFRVNDRRLRFSVYLLWNLMLALIISILTLSPLFVFVGIIWALYGYGISAASGPLNWIADKLKHIPYSGLFYNLLVTLPWYMYSWPAEKMYDLFFWQLHCLNMGAAYIEKGEYEKALIEIENAMIPKDDKKGLLMKYSLLAEANAELGRYDDAINDYTKAIEYDSEDNGLKLDLAWCHMMKKNTKEALGLLLNSLNIDQENPNLYIGIARCYLIEEKYNQAIKYLKQLIELDENSAAGHKMLAEAYMELGNESQALKEAKLSLTLNPQPNIAEEANFIIDCIQNESEQGVPASISDERIDDYSSNLIDQDKKNESDFIADIIETEKGIKEMPTEESAADNMFGSIFCSNPNCAKELPGDSVYCGYCGMKLEMNINEANNPVSIKEVNDNEHGETETQNIQSSKTEEHMGKKGITDDIKIHIKQIIGEALKKAGISSDVALKDKVKFDAVVAIVHKLLPLPVRVFVKKDALKDFVQEVLSQNEGMQLKKATVSNLDLVQSRSRS